MKGTFPVDRYLVDALMRDLTAHDRKPSAFLVYLYLWSRTRAAGERSVRISLNQLAAATGLSKSAVQSAVRVLNRRRLIRTSRVTATAVPEYAVLRPWVRWQK